MTAAINLAERLFVDDAGAVLPITNLFDIFGNECGPEEAVSAVAGEGDCWHTISLSDFKPGGFQ